MTTLNAFFLSTSCRTAPPVRRGASRVRPSACWRVAMDGPCAPPREQKAARLPPRTPTQPGWRAFGDQRKDPESIAMELGRPWGATQCYPCPAPTPAIPTSWWEFCFQQRTAVQDARAHATRTGSQPALGNMPWCSFPNVGTKGVRGGVVSVVPCHGGLGTSSCLSWGLKDRQGLTSHTPLQPCCLTFRPRVLMSYLGCIFFVTAKQWQKPELEGYREKKKKS